jgi:mRNA interferase MazF
MSYQKYDIVLALFPFTNLTNAKRRPIVIIKDLEGDNIVACQITTKKRNFPKYIVSLEKSDCSGDIRFNSFICCDLITTLHKSLIFKKIGSIKREEIKKDLDLKLKSILLS